MGVEGICKLKALSPTLAQLDQEPCARDARLSQRRCRRFAHFDIAIEKIFAGSKELQALPNVVGGVSVEAEEAVQQVGVGVIVVLPAAHAALQAQCADAGTEGAQIQGGEIARNLGNPVAEILGAPCNGGVRELIAAVDRQPAPRREFEIKCDAAALDLAEVFALEQNRRGGGIEGEGGDGPINLGEKITGTNGSPAPLARQARFPPGGALT